VVRPQDAQEPPVPLEPLYQDVVQPCQGQREDRSQAMQVQHKGPGDEEPVEREWCARGAGV